MKGWYGNKMSHSLASKGIKTKFDKFAEFFEDKPLTIDEWIDDKDGRTEIDYVKEVISKADGFGPGLYVVGDRAVLFDGTNYQYDY